MGFWIILALVSLLATLLMGLLVSCFDTEKLAFLENLALKKAHKSSSKGRVPLPCFRNGTAGRTKGERLLFLMIDHLSARMKRLWRGSAIVKRSAFRALARRDITVPIGSDNISAISR
jgi:hypothetical protein